MSCDQQINTSTRERRTIGRSPQATDEARHLLATVLAAGYLRLLAQRDDAQHPVPAGQEPRISVDSCGQQSVNWLDKDGERDA